MQPNNISAYASAIYLHYISILLSADSIPIQIGYSVTSQKVNK